MYVCKRAETFVGDCSYNSLKTGIFPKPQKPSELFMTCRGRKRDFFFKISSLEQKGSRCKRI